MENLNKDINTLKEEQAKKDQQKEALLTQEEKDFAKLYNKYTHEQFFSKYFDKETGTIVIKDLGIIILINPEKIKDSDFQADIIGDIILKFMQKDGYYFMNNGFVTITDKGKEYIKDVK